MTPRHLLVAQADFDPAFPSTVVGLIPLILLTSAIELGLIENWKQRIQRERTDAARTRLSWYASAVAGVMAASSFAAIVVALLELKWRTNVADGWLLVLTMLVVGGLAVALFNRMRASLLGDHRSSSQAARNSRRHAK